MFVSGLVDHDRVPQHRPGLGRGESLSLSASLVGSRSGSIVAPRRVSAAPRRPASASSRRVPRLFPAWEATGPWSRPDTDPKGSRQAATQRSRPSTCHSRKSVNRLPHPPAFAGPLRYRAVYCPAGIGPGPSRTATSSSRTIPWRFFDDLAKSTAYIHDFPTRCHRQVHPSSSPPCP